MTDSSPRPLALLLFPFLAALLGAPGSAQEDGRIVPSFEEGRLLLEDERGIVHRLSWSGEEEGDVGRPLPAGRYRLTGYSILRQQGGQLWMLNAAAIREREVVVEPGVQTRVAVEDRLHVDGWATRRTDGVGILLFLRGSDRSPRSLYRAGRRREIEFRVEDADGSVLATGAMEHG